MDALVPGRPVAVASVVPDAGRSGDPAATGRGSLSAGAHDFLLALGALAGPDAAVHLERRLLVGLLQAAPAVAEALAEALLALRPFAAVQKSVAMVVLVAVQRAWQPELARPEPQVPQALAALVSALESAQWRAALLQREPSKRVQALVPWQLAAQQAQLALPVAQLVSARLAVP